MSYAVPNHVGSEPWRLLEWPALKIRTDIWVRPGPRGETPDLLAAVGAVEIVDPGPTPPDGQTVDRRIVQDVDGVPTFVYLYRDRTDPEIKGDRVTKAVATLRQWSTDADGVTVTTGNAVQVLQQTVERLGVFFDRFADLLESDRLR